MSSNVSRRNFFKQTAFTTAGVWLGTSSLFARKLSANDKLNIGVIGTMNRAASNIAGVKNQNIVAICDVDETYLAQTHAKLPSAKTYIDFRRLIDQKDIDAIVVSTPDHTHAVAALTALKSGRPVYCEKPLAHTVHEVRALMAQAAKSKLPTQMGTQIHATENYRRAVEIVQSGVLGPVKEVHVWCEKSVVAEAGANATAPVPKNFHYDEWLGPVPKRDFHADFAPKTWRHWWDFGGGTLGDMGCHYIDLAFWALNLRWPIAIETEGPPVHAQNTPAWVIATWDFAARADLAPVRLKWYDGAHSPKLLRDSLPREQLKQWRNGVLFVGSKGMLLADYNKRLLLPENGNFETPKPYIAKSLGHHEEWILACKTGSPTTCNFDYSGPLAETVLLGIAAYRSGQKLQYDGPTGRITNTRAADEFLTREYRKGWSV
ncbi:MAG: putative dehydrogenase [Verrucomicrobiales bacterium]|nr:putative dehydrogenase [Verrucomicrobiales bacterium]